MVCSKSPSVSAVLIACLLLFAAVPTPAYPGDQELRLKAAFVLNFLKFAEWPASAMGKDDEEIVLAVIGESPMGKAIEETLEGKTIQGRKVTVRLHPDLASWRRDAGRCHALFMTTEAWPVWQEVHAAVSKKAVLTIAQTPGFCRAGGALNLYEGENRIRFEANPGAAGESGLTLRAELLKLAKIVETEKK